MTTPTYVIFSAIAAALAITLIGGMSRIPRARMLSVQLASVSAIWILISLGGEVFFGWAANGTCSIYLGCVDGFAGYDAFEHLLFGIAAAFAVLWLCERYPNLSILPSSRWKAALVIVAVVALLSVCWEILEYMHDAVSLDIFHEPLRNFRLHINNLDQPTNGDTVGDLTFALLGSIIGFFI